eukprot:944561-Pyramimonas_sp.AAC.1
MEEVGVTEISLGLRARRDRIIPPTQPRRGGGMTDEVAAAGDSPTSGVDYAGLPGLPPWAGARDIFPLPLQGEVEGVLGAGHRGGRERRRLLH